MRQNKWSLGWVVVVCSAVLVVAGCGSSRFTSNRTTDFVTVDTTEASGPTVVSVYENYQLSSYRPQQFLPLERPDPDRAGTFRDIVTIRTNQPYIERGDVDAEFYGFTMCALEAQGCTPEQVTLFFTLPSTPGARRLNTRAYEQFDRPFDRRLEIQVGGTTIDAPQEPSYERHTFIWELWFSLPYETFRRIAAADEEVVFTFGRTDLRFRGRELRPYQAMVAAVEGSSRLPEKPAP